MRCTGLFGPAAVASDMFYDPDFHSSAARDSFWCQRAFRRSAAAKSHSRCRAPNPSRRCTDYSHRNKEHRAPRGAGDTTETSLPPSEQSISRDDATSARRPLTTRHTLTPTTPTALTARYRYHGLLEHCEKIAGKGKRDEIADHRPRPVSYTHLTLPTTPYV